jgi:hypothetical protein
MFSCSEQSNKPAIEKQLQRQELKVTINFYPNLRLLNQKYNKEFGDTGNIRTGFAVWANPGKEPYWCDIHVLEPKSVDDERTLTLGHELAHCIYGSYHKE